MREYILTDTEKKAVEKFLQDGISTGLIRVLKVRGRQHLETLKRDLQLLEELLR